MSNVQGSDGYGPPQNDSKTLPEVFFAWLTLGKLAVILTAVTIIVACLFTK